MARKPSKSKSVEPEEEVLAMIVEEDLTEESGSGKAMSKAEAARQAIASGYAGPQEGSAYIKQAFGMDVSPQHFSAIKSNMKKSSGTKTAPKSQPSAKRGRPVGSGLAHHPTPAKSTDSFDVLLTLEALKPLLAEHGAENLKRMVDLLK